ncbi:MAG: hypothetical protein HQP61_11130 [Peptococcaceae bacterium]|nr:hypothetical protein [Candidatus Syntrophopropionicum ammoniitolerans]
MRLIHCIPFTRWATPVEIFVVGAIVGAVGFPLLKKGWAKLEAIKAEKGLQIRKKNHQENFWWTGVIEEARERHKRRAEGLVPEADHPSTSAGGCIRFGAGSEF